MASTSQFSQGWGFGILSCHFPSILGNPCGSFFGSMAGVTQAVSNTQTQPVHTRLSLTPVAQKPLFEPRTGHGSVLRCRWVLHRRDVLGLEACSSEIYHALVFRTPAERERQTTELRRATDFRSHLSPTPWIWHFKEFDNFRYGVKDKFRSAALFFSGLLILKPILLIMMYTPRLLLRSGIADGKSRPNVFRSAKWQEMIKLLSICVYPSKLAEDVLGWVYRCTSIMWSVSGHLAELFPCLKSARCGDVVTLGNSALICQGTTNLSIKSL